MVWCEGNGVDYVLGLARNARLQRRIDKALRKSRRRSAASGQASRRFREFRYRTLNSWSRSRRVVGKEEWLPGAGGGNPRFVVTSLDRQTIAKQALYEELYCARGDMENRIKEQQLWLFADRTSTATMRANQLRLYFSAFAGILLTILRRAGLQGTELANARFDTIRARLIKLAGRIKVSVRRVRISLSSVYPLQELFAQALTALRAAPVWVAPRCASHLDSAGRSDHEPHRSRPDQGEVRPNTQLAAPVTHHYDVVSGAWHENHGRTAGPRPPFCPLQTPAPSTRDQIKPADPLGELCGLLAQEIVQHDVLQVGAAGLLLLSEVQRQAGIAPVELRQLADPLAPIGRVRGKANEQIRRFEQVEVAVHRGLRQRNVPAEPRLIDDLAQLQACGAHEAAKVRPRGDRREPLKVAFEVGLHVPVEPDAPL